MLRQLNEISNAFKHSFVNTDVVQMGRDEPHLFALELRRNKLVSGIQFHVISFQEIIDMYSQFYVEANNWLQDFSEEHREVIAHRI